MEGADQMHRNPTLADFADWVQHHLDNAIKSTHKACQAVTRINNSKGLYRSGNTIIECFDAAYVEFDKGVDAALGALKDATEKGVLDEKQLRETTKRLLDKFIGDIKHACLAPMFREWGLVPSGVLDEKEAEFRKKVDFAIRHFEVGNLKPSTPPVPPSMNINVGSMSGSVIQQGSTGSTQTASVNINYTNVKNALVDLEAALKEHPAPQNIAAEIEPELQTIKAQLAKSKPSTNILREAGSTLRSVAEGVAAGLLAPKVLTAISTLLTALGLPL